MNSNPEDDQLRALFGELKRADDRGAPSFEADWAAAGAKPDSFVAQLRIGRLAGGLLIVAVGIGLLFHKWSPKPPIAVNSPSQMANVESGATPMSLDDWQSPTAFLLADPDQWGQATEATDESSDRSPSTQPQPRRST